MNLNFRKVRTKKVQLSNSYVWIKELSPLDRMAILELCGDKKTDDAFVEDATVAFSIVKVRIADTDNYKEEDCFIEDGDNFIVDEYNKKIIDEDNEDNYIQLEDGSKKLKPYAECSYLIDRREPKLYKLDETKAIDIEIKMPTTHNEILELMNNFSVRDSAYIMKEVFLLNRPNPYQLGK